MSLPQSEVLMAEIVALCTKDLSTTPDTKHIHASDLSPVSCLKSSKKIPSLCKAVRFAPRTSEGDPLKLPKKCLDESETKYQVEIARLKKACQIVSHLQASDLVGELFEPDDQVVLLEYAQYRLEKLQLILDINKANLNMVTFERRLSVVNQYLVRGKNSLDYTSEAWYQRNMEKWESFPANKRVGIPYQTPEVCEAFILEKREIKFEFESMDRLYHFLDARVKQNCQVEKNLNEQDAAAWKRIDISLGLTPVL